MKLDLRAAKSLKAGEHINIEGCPGFRLVGTSGTTGTWTYRFRSPVDDKIRQVKIGDWPSMSIAAATAAWEALRAARDSGRDPAKEKRAERTTARAAPSADSMLPHASPTVRDVAMAYLRGHVQQARKLKGANEVKRMFDTMLGPVAEKDAATLTRRDAFSLIEGYAAIPVQAQNLKRELGAAFDYALDSGLLPEASMNWWRQILRGKLKSQGKKIAGEKIGTAKRVLSANELGELVTWLPNFSRLVEDALALYLWTGTRGAEIMAMTGAEVADEPAGLIWTLPKAKTKNARHANAMDLRVPLIGRAEKIVRRRKEQYGGGYLFPSEKGAGHTQQKMISESVFFRQPYCKIRDNWDRARLTVTHWSPHDCRRSVRTLLAALGCPHEIGEAIIGHMLPGVGGIYNLYRFDPERREWLTRLDAELERLSADHLKGLAVAPA
ncbi:tyrosine-type recombinase/integrase [Paraburkholderia aromaticivorans]|uniref:tyrosine-type recombinase/integrase n=1 Tax=Paraburkholderia aromaticivorans TaxID=2026199 RepID=UPI001455E4FA|nr:integrase arm-type DNA-binding domain-containing protein [Paraburkholderia aromaticivorans]